MKKSVMIAIVTAAIFLVSCGAKEIDRKSALEVLNLKVDSEGNIRKQLKNVLDKILGPKKSIVAVSVDIISKVEKKDSSVKAIKKPEISLVSLVVIVDNSVTKKSNEDIRNIVEKEMSLYKDKLKIEIVRMNNVEKNSK